MPDEPKTAQDEVKTVLPRWLPLATELWILSVIVVFLIVRVLGSNTVKHLLHLTSH